MANHQCALHFPLAACLEASRLLPTPGREAGPDVSGSGKPVSGFGEPPPHQAASIKRSCARSGILTAGIKSISVYLRQDVLGLCASEFSSRLCLLRLRGFFFSFLFFSFLVAFNGCCSEALWSSSHRCPDHSACSLQFHRLQSPGPTSLPAGFL